MVNALDIELQQLLSETYSTHSSFGSAARISPKGCPAPPLREVPRSLHGGNEWQACLLQHHVVRAISGYP